MRGLQIAVFTSYF